MDITLTQIKINEKNIVLNLFKEAAERISKMNIDHWRYWKNPPVEKVKWVEDGILNNEFFFVKGPDGRTLGMVRILEEDLLYWGQQNDKSKYVHSLVIIEKFTGKELGKIILQKIENDAGRNGYKYLRLDSDSKNPKLCNYYERQGFKKVGIKVLPISTYNLYQKEIG